MSDLPERVARTIQSRRLLRRGEALLVAVSGGVDSMVLLHVLHQLASQERWKLSVAHLNHQLRGRSAAADERLVVRTARELGLRVVSERVAVKKIAAERKVSIEMAARQARHAFLGRVAAKWRIRSVVLAHHLDDQVELFFIRLLRGSGNEGLAGMKLRSRSSANAQVELVRPLLEVSKADLIEFAREQRIPFREDATNASLHLRRNRIRHELIPLLRTQYQPALERTISRVMDIAGQETAFVSETAARWLTSKGRNARFDKLAIAVQRRAIQLQLLLHKLPTGYDLVERLRLKSREPVSVGRAVSVFRQPDGRVEVRATDEISECSDDQIELNLERAMRVRFGGLEMSWRIRPGKPGVIKRSLPGIESFDADKVGVAVRLRHWRPGDRFQPIGMASPVKVQDLFTNQRIPRARRAEAVVAESEGGKIFWVEGLRMSEPFKVVRGTKRRLEWRWKRVNPTVAG